MLSGYDFVVSIHGYVGIFLSQAVAFPLVLATRLAIDTNTASRVKEVCMGQLLFVWMQAVGCWDVVHESRWPKTTGEAEAEDLELYMGPFVVVANHSNFCDNVLLTHMNIPKRYLTNSAYSAIPVFGWTQRLAGDIVVDLKSPESRAESVKRCAEVLTQDQCSVVIFPEGTRAPAPPTMLPFKSGAFRIAVEAGVPVLPVVLVNTHSAMGRQLNCKPARDMRLIVCRPIPTQGISLEQVMSQVREVMEAELALAHSDKPIR